MDANLARSYLPVPEIKEPFRHSTKQPNKGDELFRIKKPPKLQRHNEFSLNRSQNSLSAHAISFKESSGINEELLSPIYNKCSNESYFEQCFDSISKIGEGSFGEVFKVRSKEDGLFYAVKKSKQFFRSENYRHERLEEVRRYEQIAGHEHCVRLYKAWEQDDRLYMQMELCQGSLEHYLAKQSYIPESKIWSILLDLLLALKSLHDRNLIHLDIKLDNILVGDDGTCKLADFGLVIDVDRANRSEATEGDSRYIAPELMQGHFSKAADIFSLGIAILELSCNLELPPNGPLWQQLRSGILPEDFIKQISIELQDIIKSMMSPNSSKRPTVNELLRHRKLVFIQHRRKRWEFLKKFKQSYRKTKRFVLSKMCNLRSLLYRFYIYVISYFKLKQPHSTENVNVNFGENSLHFSQIQRSPSVNFMDNSGSIVNSTPINPHHTLRVRNLAKTSLRNDISCRDSELNNSFGLEDFDKERQIPAFVVNLETSTLVGKKLFKCDDSD